MPHSVRLLQRSSWIARVDPCLPTQLRLTTLFIALSMPWLRLPLVPLNSRARSLRCASTLACIRVRAEVRPRPQNRRSPKHFITQHPRVPFPFVVRVPDVAMPRPSSRQVEQCVQRSLELLEFDKADIRGFAQLRTTPKLKDSAPKPKPPKTNCWHT